MTLLFDWAILLGIAGISLGAWIDNLTGFKYTWPYILAFIGLVILVGRFIYLGTFL